MKTLSTAFCAAILAMAAAAAPASAQSQLVSAHLDLVADGTIRAELFSCIRRGISSTTPLSFIDANDPTKTHTISVRALPTHAGRRLSGYVASVIITSTVPAALRERLTANLQPDDRSRVLAELRAYGTTELARLIVTPPGFANFCDKVAAEIETGLFDTSARGRQPAQR